MKVGELRGLFQCPGKDFRGAPFWSWNAKLDPKELVAQVKDMKAHGMGGFFMHSREGLETEYMSDEWMECIREVVKASKEIGMNAWLYDEDRWPSGFAGGLVPSQGDEFRAKALVLDVVNEEIELSDNTLAAFRAKLDDKKLVRFERVSNSGKLTLGEGEVGLLFFRVVDSATEWFNDEAYSDNLNPDAVKEFIECTYEAYKREVGEEFGKTVPGIFTDEPNVLGRFPGLNKIRIPWTDGFVEYFKERKGYDLLDYIPEFFFDGERSAQIRHDYWEMVTRRFVEAYSKQLGEWCEENNLALTGHFLFENDFPNQITYTGAAMPHYVYQQVPGIDILTESIRETLTVKQCTSVANQFDRKWVLSETYGCSGWEFTFEGQKWVGDWQYALGINLRCQHLALYSIKGCRKRDYPPSFNYNTTWWKYNGVVEDYFARIGAVMVQGKPVRDVLMIHPISSAWTVYNLSNLKETQELSDKFQQTVEAVLAYHFDCDLGDELILADYGKVVDGRFVVAKAAYKVVVLPAMLSIKETTMNLLKEFMDNGGKVLALRQLPTLVDGKPGGKNLNELFAHENCFVLENVRELGMALEKELKREISIRDFIGQEAPSFVYHQRSIGNIQAYFIVNLDRNSGYDVEIDFAAEGNIEEWDALTGKVASVPYSKSGMGMRVSAKFAPAESKLYVINNEPACEKSEIQAIRETPVDGWWAPAGFAYMGPECEFERTDPNILTLDTCEYRFKGEDWSRKMPVWEAQKEVRERLGMRSIVLNGIPQRYRWCKDPHPNDGAPVEFRFSFDVKDIPIKPIYLALEGAEEFTIKLNGQIIDNTPVGWYLDKSFKKILLPTPRQGMNEMILSCEYKNHMEVEDCFILGDFAVSLPDRSIIAEKDTIYFGDWCFQGYPHYAGSIIYKDTLDVELKTGERVFVRLGDYSAVNIAVWVNQKLAGHIPWKAANGLDITEYLVNGSNEIGIEVVSSPRNMLGPFHRKAGYQPWTDARSFRTTGAYYTDSYVLWRWGLQDPVTFCKKS